MVLPKGLQRFLSAREGTELVALLKRPHKEKSYGYSKVSGKWSGFRDPFLYPNVEVFLVIVSPGWERKKYSVGYTDCKNDRKIIVSSNSVSDALLYAFTLPLPAPKGRVCYVLPQRERKD